MRRADVGRHARAATQVRTRLASARTATHTHCGPLRDARRASHPLPIVARELFQRHGMDQFQNMLQAMLAAALLGQAGRGGGGGIVGIRGGGGSPICNAIRSYLDRRHLRYMQADDNVFVLPYGSDKPTHIGVTCDGCLAAPIVGARYKCRSCDDFDLVRA